MTEASIIVMLLSALATCICGFVAYYVKGVSKEMANIKEDLHNRISAVEKRQEHTYLKPETAEQIELRLAPTKDLIVELKEALKELRATIQSIKSI